MPRTRWADPLQPPRCFLGGGERISRCTPQLAAFVLGMDLVYEMPRESATERANEIEWYITSSSVSVDGSSLLRGFGTYQACYDDSPCRMPTIGLQITSYLVHNNRAMLTMAYKGKPTDLVSFNA